MTAYSLVALQGVFAGMALAASLEMVRLACVSAWRGDWRSAALIASMLGLLA